MSSVQISPHRSQTYPDLTALAASLQEAAQALLAVAPANMPDVLKDTAATLPTRKDAGETRSFYFPAGAVRLEKDLLQKYRADDFQGFTGKGVYVTFRAGQTHAERP